MISCDCVKLVTSRTSKRPNPQERGSRKRNHNLKEAKAKNFCETPSHSEMNKEYQLFFSDFSMNK